MLRSSAADAKSGQYLPKTSFPKNRDEERYDRYVYYCLRIQSQPLEFAEWLKKSAGISDFSNLDR